GFDAHRADPLGGMALSSAGYAGIAAEILRLAREACGGKVVFALEGGYNLMALEESIRAVLEVASGGRAVETIAPGAGADPLLKELRSVHGQYWASLRRS
ncbi:MAG TPA: histone deacetylase, partial [Vicinamibacteria bacterium]